MPWPVESSEIVYENPWIAVREDRVTRPDGTKGIYGVMEMRHPAVFVVAVTPEEEIVLVTIDRHTVGTSIEVPAGGSDGEDLLLAAQRELAEEAGLESDDWHDLGSMTALNGVCRAPEQVFLARGVRPLAGHTAAEQELEGITAVRRIGRDDLFDLIASGGITDSETLAALMRACIRLGWIDRSQPAQNKPRLG